jgi:PKD repeat protein
MKKNRVGQQSKRTRTSKVIPLLSLTFLLSCLLLISCGGGGGGGGDNGPTSYTVSGNVKDNKGNPLGNMAINIQLKGKLGDYIAWTNSNGYYTYSLPATGLYQLTPIKEHYTFSPPSRDVNITNNISGIDYTGTSSFVNWVSDITVIVSNLNSSYTTPTYYYDVALYMGNQLIDYVRTTDTGSWNGNRWTATMYTISLSTANRSISFKVVKKSNNTVQSWSSGSYAISEGATSASINLAPTFTGLTPIADFSASPQSGIAPLTVAFSDQSQNNKVQGNVWNFGDGSSSVHTTNPTHVYNTPGTYTVSLQVANDYGTDSRTKYYFITVAGSGLKADFSASPLNGPAPLSVAFTDLSHNNKVDGNVWSFGDGESSIQTTNPVHVYKQPGLYTVSLVVSNDNGTDYITKNDYVEVTQSSQPLEIIPIDPANWPIDWGKVGYMETRTARVRLNVNVNSGETYLLSQIIPGSSGWAVKLNPELLNQTISESKSYDVTLTLTNNNVELNCCDAYLFTQLGRTTPSDPALYIEKSEPTITWKTELYEEYAGTYEGSLMKVGGNGYCDGNYGTLNFDILSIDKDVAYCSPAHIWVVNGPDMNLSQARINKNGSKYSFAGAGGNNNSISVSGDFELVSNTMKLNNVRIVDQVGDCIYEGSLWSK